VPFLERLRRSLSPCISIAGCGHYRRRRTPGTADHANAFGEMLLKQNRSAYRAELMDASGISTRWGPSAPRASQSLEVLKRESKRGELTVLRQQIEKRFGAISS
jgi:hypothetical protein